MIRKLLALFLIVSMMAIANSATAAEDEVEYGNPQANSWDSLQAAFDEGGTIILTSDISGDTQFLITKPETILDLNNFTVTYSGGDTLFYITADASLEIDDSNPDGCGSVIINSEALLAETEDGDSTRDLVCSFFIERGIFNKDITGYDYEEDSYEVKDNLWYVHEHITAYELSTEPNVLILKEGGTAGTIDVIMTDHHEQRLENTKYDITEVKYGTQDNHDNNEEAAGTDSEGGDEYQYMAEICSADINNDNRTITVTPHKSGLAVLTVHTTLTDASDPSYTSGKSRYSTNIDVAVESNEGYTLSFSEDTVWTVPNQPTVVTVTLTDANGEVVDPSEYKLLLESDAQGDEDTVIKISGNQITVTQTDDWEEDVVIYAMESGSEASGAETRSAAVSQDTDGPLKLYKVATLHIRPESERPAAASGGSGGGCNAFGGTAALFAAGALFLALRLKKK